MTNLVRRLFSTNYKDHGLHFFSFLLPAGVPLLLAPFLVLLELISYCFCALSLGIRLFALIVRGSSYFGRSKEWENIVENVYGFTCKGILLGLQACLVLLPLPGAPEGFFGKPY
jgi:hypothetical protein